MTQQIDTHNFQDLTETWNIHALAQWCYSIAPDQHWSITEETETSFTVACETVEINIKLTFD